MATEPVPVGATCEHPRMKECHPGCGLGTMASELPKTVVAAVGVASRVLSADTARREGLRAALWLRLGCLTEAPSPRRALDIADEAAELEYRLTGDTQAASCILDVLELELDEDDDGRRGERMRAACERLKACGIGETDGE
jgi:hypothetical protein